MRARTAGALGYGLGMVGPRRTLRLLRRTVILWGTLLLVAYGWFRSQPLWLQTVLVLGVLAGLVVAVLPRRQRQAAPGWGPPRVEREPMPAWLRQQIIERDGYTCGICNLPVQPDDIHIDHIHPVALGGTDNPDNLQVSHSICNMRKGARVWQPPYRETA